MKATEHAPDLPGGVAQHGVRSDAADVACDEDRVRRVLREVRELGHRQAGLTESSHGFGLVAQVVASARLDEVAVALAVHHPPHDVVLELDHRCGSDDVAEGPVHPTSVADAGRFDRVAPGDERIVATAIRDQGHDHNIVADLVGLVLAVGAAVLVLAGSAAAAGFLLLRWIDSLGG